MKTTIPPFTGFTPTHTHIPTHKRTCSATRQLVQQPTHACKQPLRQPPPQSRKPSTAEPILESLDYLRTSHSWHPSCLHKSHMHFSSLHRCPKDNSNQLQNCIREKSSRRWIRRVSVGKMVWLQSGAGTYRASSAASSYQHRRDTPTPMAAKVLGLDC